MKRYILGSLVVLTLVGCGSNGNLCEREECKDPVIFSSAPPVTTQAPDINVTDDIIVTTNTVTLDVRCVERTHTHEYPSALSVTYTVSDELEVISIDENESSGLYNHKWDVNWLFPNYKQPRHSRECYQVRVVEDSNITSQYMTLDKVRGYLTEIF